MPSTDPRGVKRKRPFLSTEDDGTKVIGKLFHGLKEVKKAAKKAKAFEIRKIVKCLKASEAFLREKRVDKLVLEAELEELKAIDHERIGTLALKNKLKKDKFLSSHPPTQLAVSKTFASGPDTAPAPGGIAAKLESRLLSSKTLSKEVNMVILSLHSALKPSGDKEGSDDGSSSRPHEPLIVDSPVATNQRSAVEASKDDFSDSGDDSSGSTDSASGSSSLQHDTSAPPRKSNSATYPTSHSPLLPDRASPAVGKESVFLPSLSNGFIPGGSDTDWSDSEARVADGVRKNRRGQRARRAIWEKKYGKGAKHLQKREGSGATHNTPTIRKYNNRPQTNPRPRLADSSRREFRAEKTDYVPNMHMSHQRESGAADDRPLHPSWAAKIRMKERSSAVIVPPQGKRIKFDD